MYEVEFNHFSIDPHGRTWIPQWCFVAIKSGILLATAIENGLDITAVDLVLTIEQHAMTTACPAFAALSVVNPDNIVCEVALCCWWFIFAAVNDRSILPSVFPS